MKKSANSPPTWVSKLVICFLLVITALLYTNLGRDALFDWDEGIYGTLGAELLSSGRPFVNTWNGETWFEKPPGISWLSAAGQLLAGRTALGARLFQPLVTTLTLYMLYLLGSKLKNWRVGLLAMGFLTGFNLFLGRARAVNTDMPLLLGIVTTLYLAIANQKPWKVALVVALSVWFKGLAGLLPLAISMPLLMSRGKNYILHTTYYILALAAPWHLFAYLGFGETFYRPYLLEQVVRRVAVPIEFHLESRWFYLNYLSDNLGLGIIIGLVIGLGLLTYRALKTSDRKLVTVIWWLIFPLALFTLAKTRLFWYILPLYPAIALILAYLLDSFATTPSAKKVVTILTLGVLSQGALSTAFSVELAKTSAPLPDRLIVASALAGSPATLAVLVPPEERLAEAILPINQRISSSFRYGGSPSLVYYYQGRVKYFYNVDEFSAYWASQGELALVARADLDLVTDYTTKVGSPTYLGIGKEDK